MSIPAFSSLPTLTIDLDILQANYVALVELAAPAKVAAVVKANAYGVGAEHVAQALADVKCTTFFVAHPQEGAALRALLPKATFYVLNGPARDTLDLFTTHNLRPVLNTPSQILLWATKGSPDIPVALHADTGMNRLGLSLPEMKVASEAWQRSLLPVALVMSHLACADDPKSPMNKAQLTRFEEIKKLFPQTPASLSASYGLFLSDPTFRQDIVRPGRALYGLTAPATKNYVTKPALRLSAPVVQTNIVPFGQSVGYNATWKSLGDRRIATLSIGYADGVPRCFQEWGQVYFTDPATGEAFAAPLTGRVSMDLLSCDVSDIPPEISSEGTMADLFSPAHSLEDYARRASLLDYEALTHLGPRINRLYGKV